MTDSVTLSCSGCGISKLASPNYAHWCDDCGYPLEPVIGPWRDGKLWVLNRKCDTCIFRPGNLMHLRSGRLVAMVDTCRAEHTVIPCHKTLDGKRSTCRGLYDVHRDDLLVLRLAQFLNVLAFDDPPEEH